MTSQNSSRKKKKAVIVGAGPCGIVCGLFLAKSTHYDWEIEIYEKSLLDDDKSGSLNPVMEVAGIVNGRRAYNIVLNPRGLSCLKDKAGVEFLQSDEIAVPLQGNVAHSFNGGYQYRPSIQSQDSMCISRNNLIKHLLKYAQKVEDQISFFYGYELEYVSFPDKQAKFKRVKAVNDDRRKNSRMNEKSVHVQYDLLIGADGVNSTVRSLLDSSIPNFHCAMVAHQNQYKVCKLPVKMFQQETSFKNSMHVWPGKNGFQVLGFPFSRNSDFVLAIVILSGEAKNLSFTRSSLFDFLQKNSPIGLREWVLDENFISDWLKHKFYYRGYTTICSSLCGHGSVALVGDSGHSMWPTLGQGCNAAIESAACLVDELNDPKASIDEALSAFNLNRKPSVDAIGRMSERFFRHGYLFFVFKRVSLSILSRKLPFIFSCPYDQLKEPVKNYSEIEKEINSEERKLFLFVGSLCCIATGVMVKLGRKSIGSS